MRLRRAERKIVLRITLAALAALAMPPAVGAAQLRKPPTADEVLERFAAGNDLNRARNEAVRLLRHKDGPGTAEEIGAVIEALVEMALSRCADFLCNGPAEAGTALVFAAWRPGVYVDGTGYLTAADLGGVPVPEAFDALVGIYETLAERALADGGDDPFLEAAWRDHEGRTPDGHNTTYEVSQLYRSLRNVFDADPAPGGRGWAYALALFEQSTPPCREGHGPPEPPDCTVGPGSAWCAAGDLLHQSATNRDLAGARPWPGPNQDLWEWRCRGRASWNVYSDWRR